MENVAKYSSTTTIDYLCDELLIEIFVRLPSYETIVKSCKFVSKHWLLLLSHPKFVVEFLNHKKQTNNNVNERRLPWAFLATMHMKPTNNNHEYNPTHNIFASPKFTLNFLPCYPSFQISATFKDLVLCLSSNGCIQRQYYICNPLIKQWVALPLTPPFMPRRSWTCLVCQDPFYDDNQGRVDYIFRVVAVRCPAHTGSQAIDPESPFMNFNTIVYCSEASQWREINLKVPLVFPRHTDGGNGLPFFGQVCEGMVCFGGRPHNTYAGMFNPFDITPTSSPTLEALALQLPFPRQVFECGGRLISLFNYHYNYSWVERQNALSMIMMEVDPSKRDHFNTNQGRLCSKRYIWCVNKGGLVVSNFGSTCVIGMHPTNKQLLYILLIRENHVVLCDVKSKCLKPLGTLPPNYLKSLKRIELQHWPTPLPHIRS